MAASGASFVRVPPQSTGKRVGTEERTVLQYDAEVVAFTVGDIVTGASSGANGTITSIVTEGFTANTGEIYLKDVAGTFSDNEALQVSAVTRANANIPAGQVDYDYQKIVIGDPDNPANIQKIDRFGATLNTFTEGSPLFSPFGAMLVGEQDTIKDYSFAYTDQANKFYDQTVGTGTITYSNTAGVMILSTGTASGALAKRTSNFYHPYSPGIGTLIEISCAVGDAGKSNVRRRWGYFDDEDGVFWELDGTTLYVVLRTSVSGSPVDTRVSQSNFSLDKLDGTDSIAFNLDVSKANIYWIDFQWLGSGRIRYGVYEPGGSRITAHTIENANINTVIPYMRSGSLPFRIEQENTAGAGSTSEFRLSCATVKHTSTVELNGENHGASSNTVSIIHSDGEVPILSIRPRKQLNGLVNRTKIKMNNINVMNSASSNNVPVVLRLRRSENSVGDLTGAAFVAHGTGNTSFAEIDYAATAVNAANTHIVKNIFVGPNLDKDLNLTASTQANHEFELFLGADANTQPAYVLTAEVKKAGVADVAVAVDWEEIVI